MRTLNGCPLFGMRGVNSGAASMMAKTACASAS
jgi:hypothetical protein